MTCLCERGLLLSRNPMPPITCIANDVMESVATILRLQARPSASLAEPRLLARGKAWCTAYTELFLCGTVNYHELLLLCVILMYDHHVMLSERE